MGNFELERRNALTKLDKSHEGKWDERILGLCNLINEHPDFYTTSSCSGRITVIPDVVGKRENLFLFKSHEKVSVDEVESVLENRVVWFRMESCALHVAARSLEQAQDLLNKARNIGWKKSGIIGSGPRYIVELFSGEMVVAPISREFGSKYLSVLVNRANEGLERTWGKIEKLRSVFEQ